MQLTHLLFATSVPLAGQLVIAGICAVVAPALFWIFSEPKATF